MFSTSRPRPAWAGSFHRRALPHRPGNVAEVRRGAAEPGARWGGGRPPTTLLPRIFAIRAPPFSLGADPRTASSCPRRETSRRAGPRPHAALRERRPGQREGSPGSRSPRVVPFLACGPPTHRSLEPSGFTDTRGGDSGSPRSNYRAPHPAAHLGMVSRSRPKPSPPGLRSRTAARHAVDARGGRCPGHHPEVGTGPGDPPSSRPPVRLTMNVSPPPPARARCASPARRRTCDKPPGERARPVLLHYAPIRVVEPPP